MRAATLRMRLELALAVLAAVLGVLTIVWHDWIEGLTGLDLDRHSGALEWTTVVLLLTVAVVLGLSLRRQWRSLAAAPGRR